MKWVCGTAQAGNNLRFPVILKIEPSEDIKRENIDSPVNKVTKKETITIKRKVTAKLKTQKSSINIVFSRKAGVSKAMDEVQKLRSAVQELLLNSNATPIVDHNSAGYKCVFCSQRFPNAADLKQHVHTVHVIELPRFMHTTERKKFFAKLDITNLTCKICQQNVSSIANFVDHLNKCHGKNVCPDVVKLLFPFKFDSDELRCCECSKSFDNFKLLRMHMHTHFPNSVCDICSAGFVTNNFLRVHKLTHKTGEFKCSLCTKVFDTRTKQKNHEDVVHKKKTKAVCEFCEKRFKFYRDKLKHLLEVHGVGTAEHKCQACDAVFGTKKGLHHHTQRRHLLLRPHKCEYCELSFHTACELIKHIPKHTGERNFKCDVCGKTFGRKNTLREHIRIHLNDRKFKCELCGLGFVQKCSLKGHMKSKHRQFL